MSNPKGSVFCENNPQTGHLIHRWPGSFEGKENVRESNMPCQICSLAFFAISSSTVSLYISSGTQQSTGHTAAH